MRHCRRELLHAQWNVLLDDQLIEAYKHGIVVECCDRITRRFYPRFLTYSADYKEKCVSPALWLMTSILTVPRVALGCIRDGGICLCPRCRIPLTRIQNVGMVLDMKQRQTLARIDDESTRSLIERARKIIYENNYAVDTDAVEAILKGESLVPTLVRSRYALAQAWLNSFCTERIFAAAWPTRFKSLQNARRWSHAWIWARRLEDFIHPSSSNFEYCRQDISAWTGPPVSGAISSRFLQWCEFELILYLKL